MNKIDGSCFSINQYTKDTHYNVKSTIHTPMHAHTHAQAPTPLHADAHTHALSIDINSFS